LSGGALGEVVVDREWDVWEEGKQMRRGGALGCARLKREG